LLFTALRWLSVLVLLAAGGLLVYLPFQRTHEQNGHAGWLLAHGDRVEATVHVTVTFYDGVRRRSVRHWSTTYEYGDQMHEGPFSCGPCPADRAVIWIRVNPADPTDFVPEPSDTSAGDDVVPGALFIAGLGLLALAFTAMFWPLRQRGDPSVADADPPDDTDPPDDAGSGFDEPWVVWRRDRHGNETLVGHRGSRTAAGKLADRLGARDRRYTYWVAIDR
jgi:hypothetical protein